MVSCSCRIVVCNFHCGDSTFFRFITNCCLARVIQSVARRAPEFIPMTDDGVRSSYADNSFISERSKGVVKERRHASGVTCFGLAAKGIVGKRDCRCAIRVDCVCQVAPCIVGIICRYSSRPDALRKFSVWSVIILGTFTISIDFICHDS